MVQGKGSPIESQSPAGALSPDLFSESPVTIGLEQSLLLHRATGVDPAHAVFHAGPVAAMAAQRLQAEAFTVGKHIFFGAGKFDAESPQGIALIGHELTHVRQQAQGLATSPEGLVSMEREAIQAERDVLAIARAVSGPIVLQHHRLYECEDGELTMAQIQRLDRISAEAIERVSLELQRRGMREINLNLSSVDAFLELEIEALTDDQIVSLWSSAIVDSIGLQVPAQASSSVLPQVNIPHTESVRGDEIIQTKERRVARGTQNIPDNWVYLRAEGEEDIYEDGEMEDLQIHINLIEEMEDVPLPQIRREVRPQQISLNGEEVLGTYDLTDEPEEELMTFSYALEEYSLSELQQMSDLLRLRGAPQDGERVKIIEIHLGHPALKQEVHKWEWFEEDSDTDTEGSDSEKEKDFDEVKRQKANRRSVREKDLLKSSLVVNRISDLQKVLRPVEDEEVSQKEVRKAIFKSGKRPAKSKIYRKEGKFKHPSVKVGDRAKLPNPPKEALEALQLFNLLLEQGIPIETAQKLCGQKFVIAQYRGLFYTKSWTKGSRRRHRNLDERNRPSFSSSALEEGPFGASGYYYLYNDSSRQEDFLIYQKIIEDEALRIKQALLKLREQKVSEPLRKSVARSTDRFKPVSVSDVLSHFYSSDYDGFLESLNKSKQSTSKPKKDDHDEMFKELPNTSIPKVSTGDVPTHAAKYAYGIKPYTGHEEELLDPEYDEFGKPKHPYSGKTYVSIHPVTDYGKDGPLHLVTLQNLHRINIDQQIIPERESQFEGLLEKDRVKAQFKAKFPNFSKDYKPVYLEEYGLSREMFKAFVRGFRITKPGTDERTFVESLLSHFLAMHAELRMIEAALDQAALLESTLVYRTGLKSFGLVPPVIVKAKSEKKRGKKRPKKSETPQEEDKGKKRKIDKTVPSKKSPHVEGQKPPETPKSTVKVQPRKKVVPKKVFEDKSSTTQKTKTPLKITPNRNLTKVAVRKRVLSKEAQERLAQEMRQKEELEKAISSFVIRKDEIEEEEQGKQGGGKSTVETVSTSIQKPEKMELILDESPKSIQPQKKDLAFDRSTLFQLLKRLEKSGLFKSLEPVVNEVPPPQNLREQVANRYGPVSRIDGSDIACYIRSLVTAAGRLLHFSHLQIEEYVNLISEHLQFVNLRTEGQMIDAGGLVAAEVRRVLHLLTDQIFDPEVHVVEWNGNTGEIIDFQVNVGNAPVWLFYTPGHFDLINRH